MPEELTPTSSTPNVEDKVASLAKELEQLRKDNSMLLEVADQTRLGQYYEKHREEKPSRVFLGVFENKTIVKWRTAIDEVIKDSNAKWSEKQVMELTFDDETTQMVDYRTFVWRTTRVYGEVSSREVKADGSITFNITLEDGRKLSIDSRFVNPF